MQRRTFITDMQHIQMRYLCIIIRYAILETSCSKVELIGSKVFLETVRNMYMTKKNILKTLISFGRLT